MDRRIVVFTQDDGQQWIAGLECGHRQHVRHDPPWSNRPWVTTEAGRAAMLGHLLPCRFCDDPQAFREIRDVRQIAGELRRRWFAAETMDLVVWCDASGAPQAFQLCYDKTAGEHALTWRAEEGFTHAAVDDGEQDDPHAAAPRRHKATPVLVADGTVPVARLLAAFTPRVAQLPPDIARFVLARLESLQPAAN